MVAYTENGAMIAKNGQLFRRVGWQITGGVNDGFLVTDHLLEECLDSAPHGGYRPIYVEVSD